MFRDLVHPEFWFWPSGSRQAISCQHQQIQELLTDTLICFFFFVCKYMERVVICFIYLLFLRCNFCFKVFIFINHVPCAMIIYIKIGFLLPMLVVLPLSLAAKETALWGHTTKVKVKLFSPPSPPGEGSRLTQGLPEQ